MHKYTYLFIFAFLWSSCKVTKNIPKQTQMKIPRKIIVLDSSRNIYSALCEPSVTIDKTQPDNFIGGSIYNNVYVFSENQVKQSKLQSLFGVYGDPCLASDNKGHLYYLHLSNPDTEKVKNGYLIDRIVIQRSDDHGKTWTQGTSIGYNPPKQQDKHWIGIDPKSGALAVTWTEFDQYESKNPDDKSRILFSRSDDFGNTWTKPVKINQLDGDCSDNDMTTEGAVPVFDNQGNIYVAWAFNDKIYFDKSTDGGKTWLANDIVVADQPGGWVFDVPGIYRTNGLPVLAIDNSKGKYSGTLYVNWADQRNGENDTDIFLSKSIDGGKTWSKPIKVNTDSTRTHQFLTWMSVDSATGFIYIIYYDRSKYTDNKTDVVLAVSRDGGKTFVTKTISNRPFIPVKSAFFGDYNNIDAFNGTIVPIWTEMNHRQISIKTKIIKENQ